MTQTARAVSIFLALLSLLALLTAAGCSPAAQPASGLEEIADQLVAEIDRYPGSPHVAVRLEGAPDESPTPLARWVREELLRLLAERRGDSFELVGRDDLTLLLDEAEFGQEGLSPENDRTELGEVAGVHLAVIFRITGNGGQDVVLNTRLVEIETQKFLAGAKLRLTPAVGLALTEATSTDHARAVRRHFASRPVLASAPDEKWRWSIELLGCAERPGGSETVFCVVRTVNLQGRDRDFNVSLPGTRLIDENGAIHPSSLLLPPDDRIVQGKGSILIPVAAEGSAVIVFAFEDVPVSLETADLVIDYWGGERTFSAVTLEPLSSVP